MHLWAGQSVHRPIVAEPGVIQVIRFKSMPRFPGRGSRYGTRVTGGKQRLKAVVEADGMMSGCDPSTSWWEKPLRLMSQGGGSTG